MRIVEHGNRREANMKNLYTIFAAALVMLVAVSCEKKEVLPDNMSGDVITLSATIGNDETKTSLGDQLSVLWSEGDAIAVIQGSNVYEFSLVEGAGSNSGVFACENYEGFQPSEAFQAFYPYSWVTSDGEINVPAIQSYKAGTFNTNVSPMLASGAGSNANLQFRNIFSLLKLTFTGEADEKVISISLATSNGKNMSGPLTLDSQDQSIVAQMTGNLYANQKVTLDCGNGVALSGDGAQFMIAVPAGEGYNFCVTVNTATGSGNRVYYKNKKGQDFIEGKIINMPSLALPGGMTAGTDNSYVANGVYLGEGVEVYSKDGNSYLVWAPVNCGYDDNNLYGLLYQWGRKYGQSYTSANQYDNASKDQGSEEVNKDKHYIYWSPDQPKAVWNAGTESGPIKTQYDPCPNGWRVPTISEFQMLYNGYMTFSDSEKGCWFTGNSQSYTQNMTNAIFLPARGFRNNGSVDISEEDTRSCYWTSECSDAIDVRYWQVKKGSMTYGTGARSFGMSVRCVKVYPVSGAGTGGYTNGGDNLEW